MKESTFSREFSIIPTFARFLAFTLGLCGSLAVFAGAHLDKTIPTAVVPLLAVLCALFGICFVLLLGYVYADAARRGMSPWLWTLICLFVPNLIGFLLYFLMRKPLARFCNKCGFPVDEGFRYCPRCSAPQVPICGSCGRPMRPEYAWCPYCGHGAGAQSGPVVNASSEEPAP